MIQPLVSIIIPSFNASATLEGAVKSVLMQDYATLELIIIDGGSTDGSMMLIEKYKSRIAVLISETDRGVYDAINKGLKTASGEWVYILGADDELAAPDVISKVMSFVTGKEKILFGDIKNIQSTHSKIPGYHRSHFGRGLIWKNTLHQQGTFYHSSVFQNNSFDASLKVLADYDLHLKLWREKTPSEHIGMTIAVCRAGGLSKQFSAKLYAEELLIKKHRLPGLLYWLNIPWVWMKYIYKNS